MFYHALTFAGSRGSHYNTEAASLEYSSISQGTRQILMQLKKCVIIIIILAYFTQYQPKLH